MKHSFSRALIFLSLLAALPISTTSQNNSTPTISPVPLGEKLKLPGVPNAGKINDSLFRGAQPRTEGFEQLKAHSDEFIARHGYVREGSRYRVTAPNRERIAVFCHGGLGLTWLAHLLDLPLTLVGGADSFL